jgi:hypothetical protein
MEVLEMIWLRRRMRVVMIVFGRIGRSGAIAL